MYSEFWDLAYGYEYLEDKNLKLLRTKRTFHVSVSMLV